MSYAVSCPSASTRYRTEASCSKGLAYDLLPRSQQLERKCSASCIPLTNARSVTTLPPLSRPQVHAAQTTATTTITTAIVGRRRLEAPLLDGSTTMLCSTGAAFAIMDLQQIVGRASGLTAWRRRTFTVPQTSSYVGSKASGL